MRALSQRSYTVQKLGKVLHRRHEPEVVQQVLDDLVERGFLDDAAYARDFVAQHAGERGERRLASDLRRRGVAGDVIRAALADAVPDDEARTVQDLLRRNLHRYRGLDPIKARRRASGFLARRGYPPDLIRQAVERLLDGSLEDVVEDDV